VAHYVGVDLSRSLVKEAQRRYFESFVDQKPHENYFNHNQRYKAIFKAIFMVNDAGDPQNLLTKVLKQERSLEDIREEIVFDIVST